MTARFGEASGLISWISVTLNSAEFSVPSEAPLARRNLLARLAPGSVVSALMTESRNLELVFLGNDMLHVFPSTAASLLFLFKVSFMPDEFSRAAASSDRR